MVTTLWPMHNYRHIVAGIAVFICLVFISSDFSIIMDVNSSTETVPLSEKTSAKTRRAYKFLSKEKEKGIDRLNDLDSVVEQNKHPLPTRDNNLTAKEMCSSGPHGCVTRFKNLETRIRVAPSHKLLSCIVQKSMSTVMTAIICFLYNEREYKKANRGFFLEWSTYRFCKDKNELGSVSSGRKVYDIPKKANGWSFNMITRDPVERFISGYVDKCIRKPIGAIPCNGCGRNMTCFIITEYKRMQEQSTLKRLARTFEDRHFFPQNWRCGLSHEYQNYQFIKYSSDPTQSFLKDFEAIARKQNVSEESILFIREQLTNERTVHSTIESPVRQYLEKRLRDSPFLMEYIIKMFYHDFDLFNYDYPTGF